MFCADCGGALQSGARFCPRAVRRWRRPSARAAGRLLPSALRPYFRPIAPPPTRAAAQAAGPDPRHRDRGDHRAAGLGVGIYFGVTRADRRRQPHRRPSATVAGGSTTIAPTTTHPDLGPRDHDLPRDHDFRADHHDRGRDGGAGTASGRTWMDLLESIPVTGQDMTAQIAAFLTPKDQAQERAAKYQADWSEPADPADIIETDFWDTIAQVMVEPDGSRAVTVATLRARLPRRADHSRPRSPGVAAGGRRVVAHRLVRAAQPGGRPAGARSAASVRSGDLLWSPVTLHELKHLGVGEGPTAPGMFVTVEFFVRNEGQNDVTPGGWQITAVDAERQGVRAVVHSATSGGTATWRTGRSLFSRGSRRTFGSRSRCRRVWTCRTCSSG